MNTNICFHVFGTVIKYLENYTKLMKCNQKPDQFQWKIFQPKLVFKLHEIGDKCEMLALSTIFARSHAKKTLIANRLSSVDIFNSFCLSLILFFSCYLE